MSANTIRVKLRPKNNHLLKIMEELGYTQARFAQYLGIHFTTLSGFINLDFDRMGIEVSQKIAKKLNIPIQQVNPRWAEPFVKTMKNARVILDDQKLLADEQLQIAQPKDDSFKDTLRDYLKTVNKADAMILEMYYGINKMKPRSIAKISAIFGIEKSKIGEIVCAAEKNLQQSNITLWSRQSD